MFYFHIVKQSKDRSGCYPMCAKNGKGRNFTSSRCTSCRGNDIYCDSSGFARLWVEINHIYRIHLMAFFLCLYSSLSSCRRLSDLVILCRLGL